MNSRVVNRFTEILNSSKAEEWKHVPGNNDPADLLTQGVSDPEKLMANRWFVGLEFLENNVDDWPTLMVHDLNEEDVKVK